MSRVQSLLARFPEPKFKRRRLYAPEKECQDDCKCFLHKHFCPSGCGQLECMDIIQSEIELRLAAENFTTDLLHIVQNLKATISNPRAAINLLNQVPTPKSPSSFEIKQIEEDLECDSGMGCENVMHSHCRFCSECYFCNGRIRNFFESRILAESIKNSYLIGIDSLRRELSAHVRALSYTDESETTAAAAAVDLSRLALTAEQYEREDLSKRCRHEESTTTVAVAAIYSHLEHMAQEEGAASGTEHEQSCPLYERDDLSKRCTCGDISPFYPMFKR
jgi:hypothetical protein